MIWAMISGANEVGLTAHRMDDDLDTGDIVLQRAIPIGPADTGTELVRATIDLIPEVLIESLDLIERGAATWTPPQNLDERTFFHKRSARDSLIDWRWSAAELDRFVRACPTLIRMRSPTTAVNESGSSRPRYRVTDTEAHRVASSSPKVTAW